jgi:phosphoribosylglycinamide formyltransferase-1
VAAEARKVTHSGKAAGLRPLRVAVLCSGRGSNLESLLSHIQVGNVNARVTLVLSDRGDAPALDVARHAKVPAIVTLVPDATERAADYAERLLDVLLQEAPDLIVLAGYMRIIGKAVLAAFPYRIVNVHPSLLPAFRGLHAVQQAHAAGARVAGCSTHYVTGELDGGPILLQAALLVQPDEGVEHLQRRILKVEHLVLPRTVQLVAEGRIRIVQGKVSLAPGPSWLERTDIDLASGVLYSDGF